MQAFKRVLDLAFDQYEKSEAEGAKQYNFFNWLPNCSYSVTLNCSENGPTNSVKIKFFGKKESCLGTGGFVFRTPLCETLELH